MKRYVLHPGHVWSTNDRDKHYIGPGRLAELYRVPLSECIIRHSMVHLPGNYIHLWPSNSGDYSIPSQ